MRLLCDTVVFWTQRNNNDRKHVDTQEGTQFGLHYGQFHLETIRDWVAPFSLMKWLWVWIEFFSDQDDHDEIHNGSLNFSLCMCVCVRVCVCVWVRSIKIDVAIQFEWVMTQCNLHEYSNFVIVVVVAVFK